MKAAKPLFLHSMLKSAAVSLLILFAGSFSAETDPIPFNQFQYSGVSLDISNETDNARANHWRPDGGKIFVTGRFSENVVSYEVSEPWDIGNTTLSGEFDLSNEFGSTDQQSRAHGLFLRDDGGKMWVFNRTEIWGYTLESPWELSSAVHTYYMDLKDFVERGHDIDFNPDGTKLFIDDRNARAVHQAELSTPWDITTITSVFTLDISDEEQAVRGLEIIADGTIMLLMDTGRKEILKYELSTPYELQSARFVDSFDVSEQSDDPRGLSVSPDMDRFYVTGRDNQAIYQYIRQSAE